MLTHEVPSNGILYLDLALDYSDIQEEDLPYLSLFARMVTDSGTYLLVYMTCVGYTLYTRVY